MHQADIAVKGDCHGSSGYLGVAVSHGNGMLFMKTHQHFRSCILKNVNQAVVEASVAGPGIERNEVDW